MHGGTVVMKGADLTAEIVQMQRNQEKPFVTEPSIFHAITFRALLLAGWHGDCQFLLS